tara:strand:+ start:1817 stop:2647 length:831 start_codon:yes stop_codon:yes gene_type:complete
MASETETHSAKWAARAAFWEKNAPKGKSVTDDLNQLLIELTDIEPGNDVLDIASGSGEPAISIALKVGSEGRVTALDAHPEMLSGARQRAETLGLTNMTFEISRMEDLPFADSTFDAVTCRFGLMSSDDPLKTLRGVRRVLKSGKKAAFMTHGLRERNTPSAVLAQVIQNELGDKDDTAVASRQLPFSEPGSLQEIFTAAEFKDVHEQEILKTVTRERDSRFWQSLLERRYGPSLEPLDNAQLAALNDTIEAAFAPHLKGDHYELMSSDMVGWGTK